MIKDVFDVQVIFVVVFIFVPEDQGNELSFNHCFLSLSLEKEILPWGAQHHFKGCAKRTPYLKETLSVYYSISALSKVDSMYGQGQYTFFRGEGVERLRSTLIEGCRSGDLLRNFYWWGIYAKGHFP